MSTLTVATFPTVHGADDALAKLQQLQKEQLITVVDAATISWPEDRNKPKMKQLHHMAAAGALGGAFWGLLFGLIFLIPVFGLAVGAAAGGLAGSMRDYGIDDQFIDEVRQTLTKGTSALFLMSQDAVIDKVQEAFKGDEFKIIHTNLTTEDEQHLKEMFGDA